MADTDPQAAQLAGKYRLIRRIGAGGMAEVYLAQQTGRDGFEKLVVIKRIHSHMAQERKIVRMFLDEARTAADLRHPSIVQIFDVDVDESQGTYFIAMEFLHGRNLREIQKKTPDGRLELRYAVQVIREVAEGLHYAHEKLDISGEPLGIVHRDVSPQNIIVTYEGATKIVDFGIAKAASRTTRTAPGMVMGKVSYMSPEQARGRELDARSDQFSLGVVLYELTTGEHLFRRENDTSTLQAVMDCEIAAPRSLDPGYPAELEQIVLTALAEDPGDRFPDCATFAEALESFMGIAGIVPSRARLRDRVRSLFADAVERIPEEAHAQKRWAATTQHFIGTTEGEAVAGQDGGVSMPSLANADTQLDPSKSQSPRANMMPVAPGRGWAPVGLVLLALVVIAAGIRFWPRAQTPDPTPTPAVVGTTVSAATATPPPTAEASAPTTVPTTLATRRTPVTGFGTLIVKAKPWAEVWVDGRRVKRQTPATVRKLEAGPHRILLKNDPAGFSLERTVEIRKGETLEVFVNVLDEKVEQRRIKGQ